MIIGGSVAIFSLSFSLSVGEVSKVINEVVFSDISFVMASDSCDR